MMGSGDIDITCFGAAHVDLIAKAEENLVPFSSTPGHIVRSVGGVACNVARQLAGRHMAVALVSRTGLDVEGNFVHETLQAAGVNTDLMMQVENEQTGSYLAIEDLAGEMALAVSDTHALLNMAASDLFQAGLGSVQSKYWFADTNLTADMLDALIAVEGRPPIAVDAVSVSKAVRLRPHLDEISLIFCNKDEAEALHGESYTSTHDAGQAMARQMVAASVITDGPRPLCVQVGSAVEQLVVPEVDVQSVTGAGDALIAATLAALIGGSSLQAAAGYGISAAASQLGGKNRKS